MASKQTVIQDFFEAYGRHDMTAMRQCLADDIAWTIPGHHPLAGVKHGVAEVVAFFEALNLAGFKAEPIFLGESADYVVDIHRGWSTQGVGAVDTTWGLVWHFNADEKIDSVINLCGDQAQMDMFCWQNFQLKPLPDRLIDQPETELVDTRSSI